MMNVFHHSICRGAAIGFICLVFFLAAFSIQAKDNFPHPTGAVNDFAGVIPDEKKTQMENLAREVLAKTGTAIVVAVVTTIGDDEINDYVNRLYSSWGIGKKGEDKGVLIFVTIKERKMRIETGYGVEGILPDGLVGEIRDKYIVPFLRQDDYGRGLLNGMIAIASVVAKDANVTLTDNPTVERPGAQKRANRGLNPWTSVIVVLVLVFLLGSRQGRDLLPFLLGFMLGGGGRIGLGGGSFEGGGFGSFGGGGFGGFGGGESGGGGAGGDF